MKNFEKVSDLIAWMREVAPEAKLTTDSRVVQEGDVFFAITVPGGKGDGRDFIANAIERGAAAIVVAAGGVELADMAVPFAQMKNLNQALGAIGNEWYNNIQADMFTVAVTGTNGKTSCSQWIARALSLSATPCAVIGT
ncbi:MAG: UDP-N-acetylmuramoyl-L-alanyl-D-glutamate--2,6-diaminopimelate ligase, partial [Burkholderiaceae bacterium]